MEITRVNGIIISEKPYKESSKLLNIITKEYGVIGVIAKGAKGIKSKLRNVSTKMTYAEFQLSYKEGKLSTLICADIINPLNNIRSNLLKIEEGLDEGILTNIAELKYLSYLGISPNFDTCAICGSSKVITLSTEKGGFICSNHHTNERIVNSKTLKIIRMLYYVDIDKITKLDVSNTVKEEINNFINEYYDRYTGFYLKSKEFLNNIKYSYI